MDVTDDKMRRMEHTKKLAYLLAERNERTVRYLRNLTLGLFILFEGVYWAIYLGGSRPDGWIVLSITVLLFWLILLAFMHKHVREWEFERYFKIFMEGDS